MIGDCDTTQLVIVTLHSQKQLDARAVIRALIGEGVYSYNSLISIFRIYIASSNCINSVKITLDATEINLHASSLWIKSLDNQLVSSLLTTCSRLININMPK